MKRKRKNVSNEKAQFMKRLRSMGKMSKEQRNKVVCSLLGHSKIQTHCFGYWYCSRCDAQVGDTLASIYPGAEKAVLVGHSCETCRTNYKALGWQDKLFAPDPFKKSIEATDKTSNPGT